MNTFKRKALSCAVLAGLGVATSAEAVVLNESNTGQVLIFPYYTVQTANGNAYNTYISITNTTSDAKVLKVRFREGKTSAEVLDFNLYLSPNDMWVGSLASDGTTADSPGRLFPSPADTSCTDPAIPLIGEPFKNFAYLSSPDSLPGTTLDRTREGYVEVFEMGSLSLAAATNVTHPSTGGAPPNCAAMRSPDGTTTPAPLAVAGALLPPTGGLYGQGTLINVANGADAGYMADALDQYATAAYYFGVGSNNPTLGGAQATPVSLRDLNGVANASAFIALSGATAGARAVASVYMHSAVMNDYILDTGTLSNTDWVLTFPVKREFVTAVTAANPFTAIMTTAGACEPALFNIFNRDELSIIPSPAGFSPPAPSGSPGVGNLCWESTVVSFRNGTTHTSAGGTNSNVLGSRNSVAVPVPNNFQNGWASATFTGANAVTAVTGGLVSATATSLDQNQTVTAFATGRTFVGLPVTGFMVRGLTNNAVDCTRNGTLVTGGCQGNYGSLFRHAFRNVIR